MNKKTVANKKSGNDLVAHLQDENRRTDEALAHTGKLREKLYFELKSRMVEVDSTIPVKIGGYSYYRRYEEGKQYEIYCRKEAKPRAPEEVLLDVNAIAEGKPYCNVGAIEVSPDQKTLAYTVDFSGREQYAIYFKDITAKTLFPYRIDNASSQIVWTENSKIVFYSLLDETYRPCKLMRHIVGTSGVIDDLVYEEKNRAYRLNIRKSRSGKFIFLQLESLISSEIRFLRSDRPFGQFRLVRRRKKGLEYYLMHQEDKFYILTNEDAPNFKLMEAPVSDPSPGKWIEVIPHRKSVMLEDADAFRDFLVLIERISGVKMIRVIEDSGRKSGYLKFPDRFYSLETKSNPDYKSSTYRFGYSSMLTPDRIYEYNINERSLVCMKETRVPGYKRSNYITERLYALAGDGVMIPISIVYRKGLKQSGNNPAVLYGYGAYGDSVDPDYSFLRLSLLDRGFVFAIAHVRGGAELGRAWYEDGKMFKKHNTFNDFIACAEYLIAEKYTCPEKLVIEGFSAGGLLIGAVLNLRPDLFRAAVADMPFVDVMTTMKDPGSPLTITEFDEWGNPGQFDHYLYMSSYSPVDNVGEKKYPDILIRAGYHDTRVRFKEPLKWAMKIRSHNADNNLVLLKTNFRSGHFGPSGRYDYIKDYAFELAFILDVLGLNA